MKVADFYIKLENKQVHCLLCPHDCIIDDGKAGFCEVRKNFDGTLMATTYGRVSAMHFDPIEKKPLYHFYPGTTILSVGSLGCNLHCTYCQNHSISQCDISNAVTENNTPFDLIGLAQSREDNLGLAFTYNEPVIWYEFIRETATISKERGLKNVLVSNGFINEGPLQELIGLFDAFSIDLKAFSEEFYRKVTSSRLSPVKDTLKQIRRSGKHLEITNLIVPTHNDDLQLFEDMVKWIQEELGDDTVLHISKYFPKYRMNIPSPNIDNMLALHSIASKHLKYVYLGNVIGEAGRHSYCPSCNSKVINRIGFHVRVIGLEKGKCKNCGFYILKNY